MSVEIQIGKSQVTDTFGRDAVVRLTGGENIFTLRGDKSFMTDYTWVVSNKINQLGNMLNINTVIVIADSIKEYYDYPNGLYNKADLIVDLNRANINPAWFITVVDKLVKNANSKGICYILIDCEDKTKFNKVLTQLDENIIKVYKDKIVVNYVIDDATELYKATINDIIEITRLPYGFDANDLLMFTNINVVEYIDKMQDTVINEIIVLHKEHAIKVKPYIN